MTERYAGKPFLRMLDCYVLDAIGALHPDEQARLAEMAPMLQETFGNSDWREVVAKEMQFPDGMAGAIREVWTKGRTRFIEAQGQEPDPLEFTQSFVDTKFPR